MRDTDRLRRCAAVGERPSPSRCLPWLGLWEGEYTPPSATATCLPCKDQPSSHYGISEFQVTLPPPPISIRGANAMIQRERSRAFWSLRNRGGGIDAHIGGPDETLLLSTLSNTKILSGRTSRADTYCLLSFSVAVFPSLSFWDHQCRRLRFVTFCSCLYPSFTLI